MLGCPVQCKYCMVTQIDSRREQWEVKPTYGINKTLFFINSKPSSMLPTIPTRWLDYEYVGYQGTSDPFWSVHEYGLHEICELSVSTRMRSLVLVTKMEEAASALSWLKQYKKVKLVVSITGLDLLERTTTASRIKTIQKAKELEIPVLPLIHPYIHGVSNLGFLKTLAKEGVEYVSLKGFRYNHRLMSAWSQGIIPAVILEEYKKANEEEILLGDAQYKIAEAGLKIVELRNWVHMPGRGMNKQESIDIVRDILENCVISSSDKSNVFDAAVNRRITGVIGE